MNGKIVGGFIAITALVAGAAIYWLQEYYYYAPVSAEVADITLVPLATGEPEPMALSDFEATDGSSSPIRFRACFHAEQSLATLTESYRPYDKPTPLNAPRWFRCFNSVEIGEALERGEALAFLSQKNIHDGVDRVVAVFPDGRAYAWQQLNEKYAED